MSITPWLPTVRKIKDGEPVDQNTVNVPIDQLTQREQHLYEKFEDVGDKSVLISFGLPLHPLETINSNELCLTYYRKDANGEGLSKCITGFNSSRSSSMFNPKDSNYVLGLIKRIYPDTNTADVYTEGLCELAVNIDDPVLGLIKNEPFAVGPYYLSSKLPGKITRDPSGIPVYVGYAINKRQFLLHTNVDEFSQFFINYRYHLLDRVAGEPNLTDGLWSIAVKEYADAPTYVENSGSSSAVSVSNISSAYVGYPSKNINLDVYTITVTTGGNINSVRFAITSSSAAFLTKNNQSLNSGVLSVDVAENNNIRLNFSGSTAFVAGSSWRLKVSTYPRKLGWIPAEMAGGIAPEGAVFYYNIPGMPDIIDDIGLDYDTVDDVTINYERDEAIELDKHLPPVPANFVQLYVSGILARFKDTADTGGIYSVNEYGIWWHSANDGEQPWSSNYPTGSLGSPVNWRTAIKSAIEETRKRMFISFSRFNPALRTQLVSSIKPFNTLDNRAANFIKFYGTDDLNETAKTGDLVVDIDAPVNVVGYKSIVSTPADALTMVDNFIYPGEIGASGPLRSSTYTSDRAIAAFKYEKSEGAFKAVLTPIVSKLEGIGAITVAPGPQPGVFSIGYLQEGFVGQVDSIEPINARLEFRGLSSYIKLPPASTTPYGLIGKIILPKGYTSNKQLRLIFHLFGDTNIISSSAARKLAFNLQYSAVAAVNSAVPTIYNTVDLVTYSPDINPVEFDITPAPAAYTAYTSRKIVGDFIIPADFIREDAIVNFKILRVATETALDSYVGNIGLLGVYWEILN